LIDPTFTDALFICGVLGLILGGVLILINQEGRVAYELTPLGIMVHGRFGSRFAGWREVVGMERRTKSIALQLQPGSNAGSEIIIHTDRIDRNGDEIEVLVARQCPNLFRKY
jgi:hypothetical protein